MPVCAIIGCSSRLGYGLPTVITNQCEKTRELSEKRRALWLARINRDLSGRNVNSKSILVCSRHFVTGKPSYLFYTTHPDWAPSLHLGYGNEKQESRKKQDLNRYLRAHARRNKKTASVQASSTPNVTAHVTEDQIGQQIENNELLSQDSMAPHNVFQQGSEQEPPGYYSFDFMIVDKEPDYMPVTNVNVQHPTSSDACYNEHEVNVMVETGSHDYGSLKNNNGPLSTSSGACYNEHEVNVKETKHAECQADLQNEELQKLRAALKLLSEQNLSLSAQVDSLTTSPINFNQNLIS